MKRAAALVLVACGGAAPAARVDLPAPTPAATTSASGSLLSARAPLFPEDPSLDATEVPGAAFAQETWTGAAEWQQHCREWGFDPSREADVRDRANRVLAPRDIHLPEHGRAKGVVAAIGSYAIGVVDHGARTKLAVCTEGVAPKVAHDAFTARLFAGKRAPHSPELAALGQPDVAWRRVHASGEVEIGFRWPHPDAAAAARTVAAVEAAHDARFRAKMRGNDFWWTGLEEP